MLVKFQGDDIDKINPENEKEKSFLRDVKQTDSLEDLKNRIKNYKESFHQVDDNTVHIDLDDIE